VIETVTPDWPAPASIHACTTTRRGGVSEIPYASLNLAAHVGDLEVRVAQNRQLLQEQLGLPQPPQWMNQVHGTEVLSARQSVAGCEGDAIFSDQPGRVCAVMTADCLPLLICNRSGSEVAALHAGWRGLADGVIESTVAQLQSGADELLVWLGPAIGPAAFEVGEEVRDTFIATHSAAAAAFTRSPAGRWLADIYQLARLRLLLLGVENIYGGDRCTFSEPEQFFSYRRDGVTGRMASLIWIAAA